jgi:O-antigen ligase
MTGHASSERARRKAAHTESRERGLLPRGQGMTETADTTAPSVRLSSIVFAARRDASARMLNVDLLALVVAALLPWTTTGVAIAMTLWMVAVFFTIDAPAFVRSLSRPASALPLAFFALVVIGTLWSGSPWPARLHGIGPAVKLLAIPVLLYHFERSQRGVWVFLAFLISCTLLMILSCVVLFEPGWKLGSAVTRGVAIKNYVDQSQEFALCMFGLALPALSLLHQKRLAPAAACIALVLCFLANMMFVVTARTALIYIPVLLALFAIRQLSIRNTMILFAVASVAAVMTWFASPYLRGRIINTAIEYRSYQQNQPSYRAALTEFPEDRSNSAGLRLEFWRKSLIFFRAAPILGNGTGSSRQLFERDAIGKSGLAAEVIDNPHNQTLNVAVQWGAVGVILLYAMWLAHLLLFREADLAAWVGLLVVVQNIVSSLFNSHLFDFVEGWMYVLGVGIAGGMTLGARRPRTSAARGITTER